MQSCNLNPQSHLCETAPLHYTVHNPPRKLPFRYLSLSSLSVEGKEGKVLPCGLTYRWKEWMGDTWSSLKKNYTNIFEQIFKILQRTA